MCYEAASSARETGYDSSSKVDIPLASNMAERVEGLISVAAPQIKNSGLSRRIEGLEQEYGNQEWRIAFIIALEVAEEKFCKFKDKLEAMEVGLRVGLSYLTNGVVSSPLEGFLKLELKKRTDGKGEYFCLHFGGPIRSAGTTATCVFVALCDYIRMKTGYFPYDPTSDEINRTFAELEYFHERITNLQYFPSKAEADFMTKNLPVQIAGDPSENIDVPNYRNLPRVDTNKLRNGFCLVFGEGLCQKAAKFWGKFSKWEKEFGMGHWEFLDEFVRIQKELRAKGKAKISAGLGIVPDYNYIKDLVAGRPVLGHPMSVGTFRVRLGRARTTGLSDDAIHPASMIILDSFIACGTQLKTERPGKSTVISSCDAIEGPIVKLKNGDVVFVDSEQEAKKIAKEVAEILFLGDILINYGYFLDRGHMLAPVGYCEEFWCLELEKNTGERREEFADLIAHPGKKLSFGESYNLSREFGIPIHPRFTYHWNDISLEQLDFLAEWLEFAVVKEDKIILPVSNGDSAKKRILEVIGLPHRNVSGEYIVIEGDWALAFRATLGFLDTKYDSGKIKNEIKIGSSAIQILNRVSGIEIRDKSGLYMGSRMGRPEKAKMRKMTGSPHSLFPVGTEGGRLRCFQASLEKGKVTAEFSIYFCSGCNSDTIYPRCHRCGMISEAIYFCRECEDKTGECARKKHNPVSYKKMQLPLKEYFDNALKKINRRNYPELIKGVRGTSNKDHVPEHLVKGILRAVNEIYVNKDGTTRYDMTEMSLTHFKSKEIGTSIEKLKELGYTHDIYGNELFNEEQILELRCQDLVLPSCPDSNDEGADYVLFRVANFVDDLLEHLYGMPRFYNLKSKEDLTGHLVVGLSPHTAAGIVGRIIGFSKTQGMLANPLFHSFMRRDCFAHDTYLPIMKNGIWRNVKIGELVENLKPDRKADFFGTLAKKVNGYYTLGRNLDGNVAKVKIKDFTKHKPAKILKIITNDGRELRVTETHKFLVFDKNKFIKISASALFKGMKLVVPVRNDTKSRELAFIDLKEYFKLRNDVMVRNVKSIVNKILDSFGSVSALSKALNLPRGSFYNFFLRDSFPLPIFLLLTSFVSIEHLPNNSYIAIKRDNVNFPYKINLNEEVLYLIGLYVAEGYARKNISKKGFFQVYFSATEKEIRNNIITFMKKNFSLAPSQVRENAIIYSSRLLYELFADILKCGAKAKVKRIPEIIMNLPLDKLKFFLQGYFDGDGSVSYTDRRVTCDSISEGLLQDLEFCFRRYCIFTKRYTYTKKPGPKVMEFYLRKNRKIPEFTITKLIITSNYCKLFYENIGFRLSRKQKILQYLVNNVNPKGMKIESDDNFAYPEIKEIVEDGFESTYCLNVENHVVMANGLLTFQCDGDESCVMLLMDALLNFSPRLLSNHRGATQDEPLVLTSRILPAEVDDMVFNMDICWKYPLELYEACMSYKIPNAVKIKTLRSEIGKTGQYEGWGFTHDTGDLNNGVRCSVYKTLPTMQDKVERQMALCEKLRAVDTADVARLIVERHFLRDIKGNLRKFSQQEFRCVNCNEKFRRPPLKGSCGKCNGRIIFTINEGGITKYLNPSLSLAEKYSLPPYLMQTLDLLKQRVEMVFGKEKERQEALGRWFN